MMSATQQDVHIERLAGQCRKAGLNAVIVGPARVRVSAPGAHEKLAETVTCKPDPDGGAALLWWWWSWGDPICPAEDIARAVRSIAHVVSPTR
jgi:hypothetical protein